MSISYKSLYNLLISTINLGLVLPALICATTNRSLSFFFSSGFTLAFLRGGFLINEPFFFPNLANYACSLLNRSGFSNASGTGLNSYSLLISCNLLGPGRFNAAVSV